jgi:hypothetical protein
VPDLSSHHLSRKQTVDLVSRWIRQQTPVAVVRFLEGEGRLLAADPNDERSMRVAIRKLRRQTGLTFSPGEMLKVKSLVMEALDRADILGIRSNGSFHPEHQAWIDLIARIYENRVSEGREPAYLGSCLLKHDLYAALPTLLHGQTRLSVVSCRNLKPVMESDFGIKNVTVYQTPSQYVMRDVDDDYEAKLHGVPIWPDFYYDLKSRLKVHDRGEVFLVGAGLFGKGLCIDIRSQGGIALDMGSVLDKMANKTTRGRNRPDSRPFPKTPKIV